MTGTHRTPHGEIFPRIRQVVRGRGRSQASGRSVASECGVLEGDTGGVKSSERLEEAYMDLVRAVWTSPTGEATGRVRVVAGSVASTDWCLHLCLNVCAIEVSSRRMVRI